MIIRSELLTEGLFGQILIWMLELVPYLQERGLKPRWEIRSKNYGQPPDFNIFPALIDTSYTPEPEEQVVSFENLKQTNAHYFGKDFRKAHEAWDAMFRLSPGLLRRLDEFWNANFSGKNVLGIHYRGTDKNTDSLQTNPVTHYQFLAVVEDFLAFHPEVSSVFVATDDAVFLHRVAQLCPVCSVPQERATGERPIWNTHDPANNLKLAEDAFMDCLSLARCNYVLKGMSQLSAFAKIFNPSLEAYRVSACKVSWFPESAIPLYRSQRAPVAQLLSALQRDDYSTPVSVKLMRRMQGKLQRLAGRR